MWKLPVFETRTSSGPTDTDLVVSYQDGGKKAIPPRGAYSALVDRFRKGEAFVARAGSTQFVRFGGQGKAENLLVVGFGPASELTEEKARQAGGSAWARLMAEKVENATVHLDSIVGTHGYAAGLSDLRVVRAFAEGLILASYQYEKPKGKAEKPAKKGAKKGPSRANEAKANEYKGPKAIYFFTEDKTFKKDVDAELAKAHAIGEAVNITREWSNLPSNVGTPEFYAAEAQKLARQYGLKCTILTERDAAQERMGLYLGVGQGSKREGRIVVLEYNPKSKKAAKTIAWVGKGITFDSGGVSIKPSARMEDMKHDMTGAATMMGATLLAAKWGVPNRIVTIMAFTENMPDGNAIQPGNVLTARNGKTVEVINTDAEGRLILADVLDYAQDFKPDAVINAATLTGAVLVALGRQACAILGNDDALIDSIRRAGEANGERIWQLPLYDEYFEDLKSDYADMKNSANDPYGGTIRGGIFLKQFIRKEIRWAHLDIAGTAYGVTHLPYLPKRGATGLTVRTLAQFAADF